MQKELRDKLRVIAEQLPPLFEKKLVKTLGADLIKSGVTADRDGQPIITHHPSQPKVPDVQLSRLARRKITFHKQPVVYTCEKLVPVNHFNKLKEAFRKNGHNGVADYVAKATLEAAKMARQTEKSQQKQFITV